MNTHCGTPAPQLPLSVAIQAGGESRRMGQDKARTPFLGQPLVQRVADRLQGLGQERYLTARDPEALAFLGLPCFSDRVPGRGALGGLCTALTHARCEWVAVVACDMPFANPALLRHAYARRGDADLVIFQTPGGLEPLHALYRRDPCLRAVEKALAADRWRVDAWFPQVAARILELSECASLDPEGLTFTNVNTPEDLIRAERQAVREAAGWGEWTPGPHGSQGS